MNGIVTEAVYPSLQKDLDNMPIRTFYFDGTQGDLERDVGIFIELDAHVSAAQEEAAALPGVLLGVAGAGLRPAARLGPPPASKGKGLPLASLASRGRAREREALCRTVAAGGSRVRVGEWSCDARSCGLASRSPARTRG